MASLEEIHRRVRQDKDLVRRFTLAWHAKPFVARTERGDPISVTRSRSTPANWRVTYYVEDQPAGHHEERSFAAAVKSALVEHRARLDTAQPFVDPAARAENVLDLAESLLRRARTEDVYLAGHPEAFVSPIWPDVFDAFEVAADAFEDIGHTFRADSIRHNVLHSLGRLMSELRSPRRERGRDVRRRRR